MMRSCTLRSLRLSATQAVRSARSQLEEPHIGGLRRCRCLSTRASPPLILLLDLDETLLRPKFPTAPEHAHRKMDKADFEVNVDVGDGVSCLLSMRPGLAEFFDWIRVRRSEGVLEGPWLFAQGKQPYIDAVLPVVDPDGDIFSTRILAHEACTQVKTPGYVLKDLHRVPCDSAEGETRVPQMILVDNNPVSAFLHPRNTFVVRDWKADREDDVELARVSATLDALIADSADLGGDYASKLAQMTPGHGNFCKQLNTLRPLLEGKLRDGEKVERRIRQIWDRACKMKHRTPRQ
eukprot:TRINITY_DN18960_c0_g1_i2.p1 TRINITY_DN18960_c0_g1~~TRINITY_DN18960_c0_g1_i2.p1  ORF type:complete len:293 (-),score=29.06 TRINITY_DN18960_c0_g1_i2:89-967(-)